MSVVPNVMQHRVPALCLHQVTKRFGDGPAILQDVSLTVMPGEFISILGPSGCGKSTLLKIVAGLSPLTSGELAIEGMTPANAREIMSFVFQDPTLLPWRNVRRNVGLGMELEHATKVRRDTKINALLSMVGLTDVANSFPRQLSGGMKMRVSIARALASSPRLLLMDEPFAALDEITRDRMNEEILRLHKEHGWTVVFVTHSVAESVFLSDRIILLASRPGRIAHDLKVDFGRMRDAELRRSTRYENVVSEVSRALRETLPE